MRLTQPEGAIRQSRFSQSEIVYAVKQVELGVPTKEAPRKYGVCENTVYQRRKKYDGLNPSELKRFEDLERKNGQLMKLMAKVSLDKHILKDVRLGRPEASSQVDLGLRDPRR